jgi:hypothetical protein
MADIAGARTWLTENLTDPVRQDQTDADYYQRVAEYIAGLPDDDPDLVRGGCHTALSRESPATFLHDLVLNASGWLAQDAAAVDRSAGG